MANLVRILIQEEAVYGYKPTEAITSTDKILYIASKNLYKDLMDTFCKVLAASISILAHKKPNDQIQPLTSNNSSRPSEKLNSMNLIWMPISPFISSQLFVEFQDCIAQLQGNPSTKVMYINICQQCLITFDIRLFKKKKKKITQMPFDLISSDNIFYKVMEYFIFPE